MQSELTLGNLITKYRLTSKLSYCNHMKPTLCLFCKSNVK